MKQYTVYEMEDYNIQEEQVEKMSTKELADYVRYVARGWLPDYNFTGTEDDFAQHKDQMIMRRVAKILDELK